MLARMTVAITKRFIALALSLVIQIAANLPQISVVRLLAARVILLRQEVRLVGGNQRQVFLTCRHSCAHCRKLRAYSLLVSAQRRGTRYGTQATQVQTAAGVACRGSLAVSSQHHLLVGCVRGFLVDSGQCTADGLDCVSIFYFCHSRSALFILPPWEGLCCQRSLLLSLSTRSLVELFDARPCMVENSTGLEELTWDGVNRKAVQRYDKKTGYANNRLRFWNQDSIFGKSVRS